MAVVKVELLAPPTTVASWSRATTRVSPASERSVTRSRKMSTEITRSFPTAVLTVFSFFREALALLDVEVMLVVQAAEAGGRRDRRSGVDSATAPALREGQADRLPLRQPARDAELAAAAPDPIQTLGLVARADLPQLDARTKQTRESRPSARKSTRCSAVK